MKGLKLKVKITNKNEFQVILDLGNTPDSIYFIGPHSINTVNVNNEKEFITLGKKAKRIKKVFVKKI